ncbi:MAG TPA: hypothetical protein VKQ72_04770 [Aggregatilineales bacterium]|nr:hypothetical protein [Aggregatilineales bacterium]
MRRLTLAFAATLTLLVIIAAPGIVQAHEKRTIAGKYDVEVGWDQEPTLVGQLNAASISITKTGTDEAVKGVDQTLKVRIAFGGNLPKEFPLHSVEGKDGYYVADLMPTEAGSYIFTFVGDIEGNPVNERFESGPNTFDDVVSLDTYQFPKTIPDSLTLASEVKAAADDANSLRGLAIAGIVLGVVGILVGGAALLTRRSADRTSNTTNANAS